MEIRKREQCVYTIPCECGGECTGETSRALGVRIRGNKYNLKEGNFDKSELPIHAFEEGREIDCTYYSILQFEPKYVCRRYKAKVHALCSGNPIIQASLEISPLCVKENQFDSQNILSIFHQTLHV